MPFRTTDDLARHPRLESSDAPKDNAAWAWVAAAVFLIVVLAAAFGIAHAPNGVGSSQMANNAPPAVANLPPPATTPLAARPGGPATSVYTPSPRNTTQTHP